MSLDMALPFPSALPPTILTASLWDGDPADRPGLLFDIAEVLASHGIRLHTAKIATLGERVEDTFLLTGAILAQDAQRLRVERELLQRLQV